MKRITPYIFPVLSTLLFILLLGGCVRIDYAVYKSKYPAAGLGGYLWNKFISK